MFDDSPVEQRVTEDECVYDLMSDAMTDHSDNVHDSVDADNEVLCCTLCAYNVVSERFHSSQYGKAIMQLRYIISHCVKLSRDKVHAGFL